MRGAHGGGPIASRSTKIHEAVGSHHQPCAQTPYSIVSSTCPACPCVACRCPSRACWWWIWRCGGAGWSARTAVGVPGGATTGVRSPRPGGTWTSAPRWCCCGPSCARVVADELDADRLAGLVHVGVDEVSWRRHHNYLTLVYDHDGKKVVWGKAGKDTATLDAFFAELGSDRAEQVEAVSMDMGPAFAASVRAHAPQATTCIDPFHAVKLVGEALDAERRKAWNELRRGGNPAAAKKFKGARWALLKKPANLSDEQAATLRKLKRRGGDVWRAYTLKEAFRAIFAGDLDPDAVAELIDRWISRASRSRLPAFAKASKTIRKFRDGLIAAIWLGINNGRAEGLNNVVRLVFRRARGFHSAEAALALVMLSCGPITLQLPHERSNNRRE